MASGKSRDDLIDFLKREVEKGVIPINTGLSRVATVRKVLSVLSDQEAGDVTALNVDEVMRRFIARTDHQYSLASHVSYKSRLRSALEAFNSARRGEERQSPSAVAQSASGETRVTGAPPSQSIQIPLPRGWTVVVDRLPIDLTEAEAQRIGKVVLAYAMTE